MADVNGIITFRGILSPMASAITVSGEEAPSARIKIDIPASEMYAVEQLMRMGGKPLQFTVQQEQLQMVFGTGEVPETKAPWPEDENSD